MHDSLPRPVTPAATDDARMSAVPTWPTALLVALVGGLVLGATDLLAFKVLPTGLDRLCNSGATWAVAAWAFGLWARRAAVGAVGGVIVMVVAVESFYVTASWVLGDDLAVAGSQIAQYWLVLGVVVGAFFGAVGALRDSPLGVLRGLCAAAGPAVLFAESLDLIVVDVPGAAVEIVLGLVLLAVAVPGFARRGYAWLWTLSWLAVLVAVGGALYRANHFAGAA